MRYILNDNISLCGYWGVPFAAYDSKRNDTQFFRKEQFMVLWKCDGQHDIDKAQLAEIDAEYLDALLERSIVRECSPDERLVPAQEYRNFNVKYRGDIQLSITGLCNYKCRHCFQGAPHAKLGTISFERLMDIADQMADCGIRDVSFTGGEPLYRDDFWDVFDGFTQRGVRVESVFTNGALLDDAWIGELDRRVEVGVPKPGISVSFDGVGWHDWLRGVEGAEEAAVAAMRRAVAHGYNVGVSMCLHRRNRHTLRDTVRLLAEMGVSSLKVNVASPQGEWEHETENAISTTEGWETYLEFLPLYFADGAPIALMLEGCFDCSGRTLSWSAVHDKPEREGWENRLACGVLRRHLYVSPQGACVPCMSMAGTPIEDDFPNVFAAPLREILQPGTPFILNSEMTARQVGDANEKCRECEHLPRCWGGCRACGAFNQGFYAGYDEAACEWHKNGWRQRFEAAVGEGIALMTPEDRAACEEAKRRAEEHDRQLRVRLGMEQPEDIAMC